MNNIENIKKIDIKTLIEKETGLTFDKHNKLSQCPFCKSGTGPNKSSAFSVNIEKNIFKCFSCDKSGNAIEFVKYKQNIESVNAIQYIQKNYSGVPMCEPAKEPEPDRTDFNKKFIAISNNNIKPAADYLKNIRNIEIDKIPAKSFFYDTFNNSVVFFDTEKKLINRRFIEPEPDKPKSLQDKGSILKNALYDNTFNPKSDIVFIVESPINALSLFPYSALSIFSSNNKIDNVHKLKKYIEHKKVVLAFDNDIKHENDNNSGQKCTEYYIKFILENIEVESLSNIILPANIDVNELKKQGKLTDFLKDTDNYEFHKIDVLKKPLKQNSKYPAEDIEKFGFFVKTLECMKEKLSEKIFTKTNKYLIVF